MRDWMRFVMAPDEGGGGGGSGNGDGGQGGQGGGAGDQGGQGGGAGDQGGQGGSAGDGGGTAPYRPEGLPETMYGDDDRGTIDKMKTVIDGYRAKEARVAIPDSADGYHDFSKAEVPDGLQSYVETLSEDPIFKAVGEKALANKWDPAVVQAITLTAFEAAHKSGLLSEMVDEQAERQALVPDSLKSATAEQQEAAAKARVDKAEDFINLQISNKKLDEGVGKHAAMMLLDTAQGVQFLEFVSQLGGAAAPANLGDGGQSADQEREALKAELAKPELTPGNPKFDRKRFAEVDARYQKLIGGA